VEEIQRRIGSAAAGKKTITNQSFKTFSQTPLNWIAIQYVSLNTLFKKIIFNNSPRSDPFPLLVSLSSSAVAPTTRRIPPSYYPRRRVPIPCRCHRRRTAPCPGLAAVPLVWFGSESGLLAAAILAPTLPTRPSDWHLFSLPRGSIPC
jgi:hypothetical protein